MFSGTHSGGLLYLSWRALNDEMKLDMQRIWKRNLGRDDRGIADNGKEVLLTTWINIFHFLLGLCYVLILVLIYARQGFRSWMKML